MYSKTVLMGRVGADPRINTVGDDDRKLASFSLATHRSYRSKGEKVDDTTWHRINVVNSKVAEIVEQYVNKGDLLLVEGRIQKRTYEKDGEERESYEIVVDFEGNIRLMPRAQNGKDEPTKKRTREEADEVPFDDDIPF